MKIIFFTDDIKGGAGNVAQQLSIIYSQKGHDVSLVFWSITAKTRYDLSSVKITNLHLEKYDEASRLTGFYYRIKEYKKVIKKIKPDLIIAFLDIINTHVLISQYNTQIPIIVSERTNPFAYKLPLYWNILRLICYKKRANTITVLFDEFKQFFPVNIRSKIITIPNCFTVPEQQKEDYSIQDRPVTFVSFARLTVVKRFDLMISLFRKIHQQNVNTRLYIYGVGPEYNSLKKLIKKMGMIDIVYLKGYCTNVSDELIKGDIYLMTSKYEGFPNALCEAMACGLPSVSISTHQGMRKIVYNDVNGYIVEENSSDLFVQRCVELAENESLRKRIGHNAKEISHKYSFDRIITLWDNTITNLTVGTKN
ncbi:glycosyltransferase [Bacteroides nordii]|uniref:glycosyltransferase n=1 Tax=Bacteroides nordii TaxID=291645 RepID=UPI00399B979F